MLREKGRQCSSPFHISSTLATCLFLPLATLNFHLHLKFLQTLSAPLQFSSTLLYRFLPLSQALCSNYSIMTIPRSKRRASTMPPFSRPRESLKWSKEVLTKWPSYLPIPPRRSEEDYVRLIQH